jgi:hypothetical protein
MAFAFLERAANHRSAGSKAQLDAALQWVSKARQYQHSSNLQAYSRSLIAALRDEAQPSSYRVSTAIQTAALQFLYLFPAHRLKLLPAFLPNCQKHEPETLWTAPK